MRVFLLVVIIIHIRRRLGLGSYDRILTSCSGVRHRVWRLRVRECTSRAMAWRRVGVAWWASNQLIVINISWWSHARLGLLFKLIVKLIGMLLLSRCCFSLSYPSCFFCIHLLLHHLSNQSLSFLISGSLVCSITFIKCRSFLINSLYLRCYWLECISILAQERIRLRWLDSWLIWVLHLLPESLLLLSLLHLCNHFLLLFFLKSHKISLHLIPLNLLVKLASPLWFVWHQL